MENNEKVNLLKRGWVKKTLIGVGGFIVGLVVYGLLSKGEDTKAVDYVELTGCTCEEETTLLESDSSNEEEN